MPPPTNNNDTLHLLAQPACINIDALCKSICTWSMAQQSVKNTQTAISTNPKGFDWPASRHDMMTAPSPTTSMTMMTTSLHHVQQTTHNDCLTLHALLSPAPNSTTPPSQLAPINSHTQTMKAVTMTTQPPSYSTTPTMPMMMSLTNTQIMPKHMMTSVPSPLALTSKPSTACPHINLPLTDTPATEPKVNNHLCQWVHDALPLFLFH